MKKYTVNYTNTSPNFVIQNLVEKPVKSDLLPILNTIMAGLQCEFPATLSKFLQSEIGEIHKHDNFNDRFEFATNQPTIWYHTIKGNCGQNDNPAKDFFEKIIPNDFGEYAFVQSLIVSEIEINEIVGEENKDFINQHVDFYLPQAKLVIDIDGLQHKLDDATRVSDAKRDDYLKSRGITTIKISTKELQDGLYGSKFESIVKHLERYEKQLSIYKITCDKIEKNQLSEKEINTKLFPTAIIRFQVLLIELLKNQYLTFEEDWNFNVFVSNPTEYEIVDNISYREEFYGLVEDKGKSALELAITDLLIRIDDLWYPKNNQKLKKPNFNIEISSDKAIIQSSINAIDIDFSMFKRYTNENLINQEVIFVRTDYFDDEKDKVYGHVNH
jgi:ATP-dependent DNA helicase RecQ